MNRVGRPYRTHQRFHRQHHDRGHQGHRQERHPDEGHQNRQRLERHRRLDVENRNLHLQDDQRHQVHQDDLDHRHQPDDLRHLDHLGGLGHLHRQDGQRLGAPFPVKVQTGCCLDEQQDEEYPCPVPKRMGCYLGVGCPGLHLVLLELMLALQGHRPLAWLRQAQPDLRPLELTERQPERRPLLPQLALQVLLPLVRL